MPRVVILPPDAPRPIAKRRIPDADTMKATAGDMVDAGLATDEATAMLVLRNPLSWPEEA